MAGLALCTTLKFSVAHMFYDWNFKYFADIPIMVRVRVRVRLR